MNIFEAIILGIIQGLAEFLPISSSGHLVLAQSLFGIKEPMLTFDVLLHIGTLVPVCAVYRNDILALIKKPFQKMTYMLVIATIPAVFAALFFSDLIDKMFGTLSFLPLFFVLTGLILLRGDSKTDCHKKEKEMTYFDALFIGIVQAIAIVPGISRSGSTIGAALERKLDRTFAAKFSFLMSIPAILGAAVLEIKKVVTGEVIIENIPVLPYALGTLSAMITGYLAITYMIKLIEKRNLKYFSYYLFALAAFTSWYVFIR